MVINAVIDRAQSPAATKDLQAGHELVAGDLETQDTKALVRHHLRKDVAKGKPITHDMVVPNQLPPEIAPTIAAIVTIQPQLLKQRGIAEGSAVEVQFTTSPLKLAGKVAKLACNELICSVIVSLTKAPPSTIGSGDFASADIVPEPPPRNPSPSP